MVRRDAWWEGCLQSEDRSPAETAFCLPVPGLLSSSLPTPTPAGVKWRYMHEGPTMKIQKCEILGTIIHWFSVVVVVFLCSIVCYFFSRHLILGVHTFRDYELPALLGTPTHANQENPKSETSQKWCLAPFWLPWKPRQWASEMTKILSALWQFISLIYSHSSNKEKRLISFPQILN